MLVANSVEYYQAHKEEADAAEVVPDGGGEVGDGVGAVDESLHR